MPKKMTSASKRETNSGKGMSSKKSNRGRPTKYKGQETIDKVWEYLDKCEQAVKFMSDAKGTVKSVLGGYPSLIGLSKHIGVARSQLYSWEKVHPEFQYSLTCAREAQEEYLTTYGLAGLINPLITKLHLSGHGVQDTQKIDHSVSTSNIEKPEIVIQRMFQDDAPSD